MHNETYTPTKPANIQLHGAKVARRHDDACVRRHITLSERERVTLAYERVEKSKEVDSSLFSHLNVLLSM